MGNFREEFKPRDSVVSETFNWPNGGITDWNLGPVWRDCLQARKDLDEFLENCHEFSDSEEEMIDSLIDIYDGNYTEKNKNDTFESGLKINFDLKSIRKQNRKTEMFANGENSSEDESVVEKNGTVQGVNFKKADNKNSETAQGKKSRDCRLI